MPRNASRPWSRPSAARAICWNAPAKFFPAAGLEAVAGIGEHVDGDHPIARIHARSRTDAERAAARILAAVSLAEEQVRPPPLIHRTVGTARPAASAIGEPSFGEPSS